MPNLTWSSMSILNLKLNLQLTVWIKVPPVSLSEMRSGLKMGSQRLDGLFFLDLKTLNFYFKIFTEVAHWANLV